MKDSREGKSFYRIEFEVAHLVVYIFWMRDSQDCVSVLIYVLLLKFSVDDGQELGRKKTEKLVTRKSGEEFYG